MTGNHLAAQGQREYEKRGECPACHKAQLEPIDWCNAWGQECDAKDCPVSEECFDIGHAAKCPECGYTTTEVE